MEEVEEEEEEKAEPNYTRAGWRGSRVVPTREAPRERPRAAASPQSARNSPRLGVGLGGLGVIRLREPAATVARQVPSPSGA